jgi:hypothetical protein
MSVRVVVWFRRRSTTRSGRAFAEVAAALVRRAAPLGGRIAAWQPGGVAFDFSEDALEDALELAAGETLPQHVAAGIAQGEIETLVAEGVVIGLALGPALERASALARTGRSGEVLLDPKLPAVMSGEIPTSGARQGTFGKQRVRGVRLDREAHGSSIPPSRRAVAERPSVLPRSASIRPGALADVDAEPEAVREAVEALKRRDFESITRLVTELRERGEQLSLADRLEAMTSLARGETSDALRVLRSGRARAQQKSLAERSRAALALAVGLAAVGRKSEALLEALDALARARAAGDAKGERACAGFLARLSRSAGDEQAARAWAGVALG